jgi:hypothetical protein
MPGPVPDEVLDEHWRGHRIPDRWRPMPRSPAMRPKVKWHLIAEDRTAMLRYILPDRLVDSPMKSNETTAQRRDYTPPQVTSLGTLREVTQGVGGTVNVTDTALGSVV